MAGQWKLTLSETEKGVGTGLGQWWDDSTRVDLDPPDYQAHREGLLATTESRNGFLAALVALRDERDALIARRATVAALEASWATILNTNDPKATT